MLFDTILSSYYTYIGIVLTNSFVGGDYCTRVLNAIDTEIFNIQRVCEKVVILTPIIST